MNPLLDRKRSATAAFPHDPLVIPVAWIAALAADLRVILPGWHPESSGAIESTESVQDRRNADA